ncbi:MAG TPA: hypothetical protein DDY78_26330 [Planctomycetales bacterium]|jgi:hypothetical protein|nr:hypothetical protein [Planctomycetales bacterium]
MKIRTLSKREVDAEPYCVWNAFIDLLAMEEYHDLTPKQRAAHLVFWYESEVQNGGHLQFFENRGTDQLGETIESLGLLGAVCQQEVLRDAGQVWLSRSRPPIETVDAYCDAALGNEFGTFDSRFGQCDPPLQKNLEEYLRGRLEIGLGTGLASGLC